MTSKGKEMELMRKMSKALITVLVLASVALTTTPVLAAESTQGIQGIEMDHTAIQDEVNANMNSQLNPKDEDLVCQGVPKYSLRFHVRGCEENWEWTLLRW